MITVYAHTSPSGKVYVGWTSQRPDRRWKRHVNDARKGSATPFHRAIRKYGADAFTHEILEVMTTPAGAKRAEVLWIRELQAFGPNGYNATAGGDGATGTTYPRTPEWSEKIARTKRGKPLTDEHKAAMSRALRGRPGKPLTPEQRARMTAGLQALAGTDKLKRGPMPEATKAKLRAAAKRRAQMRTPEQRAISQDIGRAGALLRWNRKKNT